MALAATFSCRNSPAQDSTSIAIQTTPLSTGSDREPIRAVGGEALLKLSFRRIGDENHVTAWEVICYVPG